MEVLTGSAIDNKTVIIAKNKLAASKEADNLRRSLAEVMVAIAQEIPSSPTVDLIRSVKDAIPHLAEVAQNLIDAVSDENLNWVFVHGSRTPLHQSLGNCRTQLRGRSSPYNYYP